MKDLEALNKYLKVYPFIDQVSLYGCTNVTDDKIKRLAPLVLEVREMTYTQVTKHQGYWRTLKKELQAQREK